MFFLSLVARPGFSRQNAAKQTRNVSKPKGFPDEMLDRQAGEGGIHRFFAIGAGDDHFQVRSYPLGLFKDLSAGDSG